VPGANGVIAGAIANGSPLDVLWAANAIAVVGASDKPGSPGDAMLGYLRRYGYRGQIVPVNPRAPQIGGERAWPTVAAWRSDTGESPPLAMILVPAGAARDAVADCAAAGVRVAIVGSSGFAETGPEGQAAQDELVRIARAHGMRLVGPNCIGSLGPDSGLVASFSPMFGGSETTLVAASPSSRGGVGFASASGALGFGVVSLALERGIPLRAAVSTGNEADVSALEVLAALAADPGCGALLGYVESLADPAGLRALSSAAASAGKPVALLVGGVSDEGGKAAASHTGALATGERTAEGVLRQFGLARVTDVAELLDVGDAFTLIGGGIGDRIAVVTTSGGSGILAADEIGRAGLRVAELSPGTRAELSMIVPAFGSTANPVDVTATVMNDRTLVRRALSAVASDEGVDVIVVCFCVLAGADVDAITAALADVKAASDKPLLVARTGADHLAPQATRTLRAAGVPTYQTPAQAVRVAAACHRAQARPPLHPLPSHTSPPAEANEAAVKRVLREAGIRTPYGWIVTSEEQALEAVEAAGGRAVFKVSGPTHKSDAGGVLLGVDEADAPDAYQQMSTLSGAAGVLVEEQVAPGVEVLVGIAPSGLGPALTLGVGGVLTELIDDAATRLLPVSADDVRDMIASTRLARMLAGIRGAPPANVEALVELVLAVADLAGGWPGELDLNPVAVTADAAIVLDAAYIPGDPKGES
jgi:acetate---CoA ligase (ADP-forming)